MLDGGAETTRTVIGAIVRELALQPDQRQLLLDDPEMVGRTAVEEFIRWVSPILNMRRTVTEDHEFHGRSSARATSSCSCTRRPTATSASSRTRMCST